MGTKQAGMVSVSPINGQSYPVPDQKSDRRNIDAFLRNHAEKPVVVVQGLGFVGAVMSLVCANALNAEYAVLGLDLPRPETFWKICSLNEGVFPLLAEDP